MTQASPWKGVTLGGYKPTARRERLTSEAASGLWAAAKRPEPGTFAVDLKPGSLTDTEHPQAQRVTAIGVEWRRRSISAALDQLAA